MLNNLLNVPEGGKIISIPTAALYALIGFVVVFAGIAFLIFVVWLVGKIMNKTPVTAKPIKEKKEPAVAVQESVSESLAVSEDLPEETVAVIMAALMAYYQKNNPKCEFTVKRIKRI